MRVNLSVAWESAPASGRIEIVNGRFVGGVILKGAGRMEGDRFSFSGAEPCKLVFAIETEGPAAVSICDTEREFYFDLRDVPDCCTLLIPEVGAAVTAEEDVWMSL